MLEKVLKIFFSLLIFSSFSFGSEEDYFKVDDIKVGCDCDKEKNKTWKTEKIDENWTKKLGINPPDININKTEDGALGETRTPTF